MSSLAVCIPLEAAAQTYVRDTFSAANGVLLRNHLPETNHGSGTWTITGAEDLVIDSGGARPTAAGNVMLARIEGTGSDGRVSMDWTPLGSESPYGPYASLVFRGAASDSYFQFVYWYGTLYLQKVTPATTVTLQSLSIGSAGTSVHHLEVRLAGATIEAYWDNALKFQVSDTYNVGATQYGMRWVNVYDYTSRYDNFTVEGSGGCGAAPAAATASFGDAGGSGTIGVTALATCA